MKRIISTLNGQKTDKVPVWLMRQAGRYLPEYRQLRAHKNGFMDMALDPEAACEVTMQPIRRFEMDAAIIFSDILMIPYGLGQDVWFEAGEGPKLSAYNFSELSLDKLHEKLEPVYQALCLTADTLSKEGFSNTALFGFAGAPWTVATYMIEGGSSKDFANTKTLAYGDEKKFGALIDLLCEATIAYLIRQIESGAEAVQIFDSWSGALDEKQFQKWAIDPAQKIVAAIHAACPGIPVIGFPKGAGLFYQDYARDTGIDAVSIDAQIPLEWAKRNLQSHMPVQGNMDPMALRAGGDALRENAQAVLEKFSGGPHIFNLGHGVNKDTPPEHVAELIQLVRNFKP